MYASVRKYSVDARRGYELMRRVDKGLVPRLERMPGFVAHQVIDAGIDRTGAGLMFTITICHDREAADQSADLTAKFVVDELADMNVRRLEANTGEIIVNSAEREMLERGHA
jgi:hypothetical protein